MSAQAAANTIIKLGQVGDKSMREAVGHMALNLHRLENGVLEVGCCFPGRHESLVLDPFDQMIIEPVAQELHSGSLISRAPRFSEI